MKAPSLAACPPGLLPHGPETLAAGPGPVDCAGVAQPAVAAESLDAGQALLDAANAVLHAVEAERAALCCSCG